MRTVLEFDAGHALAVVGDLLDVAVVVEPTPFFSATRTMARTISCMPPMGYHVPSTVSA